MNKFAKKCQISQLLENRILKITIMGKIKNIQIRMS